jgi:hypothetical protein
VRSALGSIISIFGTFMMPVCLTEWDEIEISGEICEGTFREVLINLPVA